MVKLSLLRGDKSIITPESSAMVRRLKEIQDTMDPQSRRMGQLRTEIKAAVVQDNEDKLYRLSGGPMVGVDRYGKALAPPRPRTLKGWERKGLIRQILAPHGLASRTITNFRVAWRQQGNTWVMFAGWAGIPWMIFHLNGTPRMAQRDIGGTSPAGWVNIRKAFDRFWASVRRKGG
jgi:hypothetical protein